MRIHIEDFILFLLSDPEDYEDPLAARAIMKVYFPELKILDSEEKQFFTFTTC